ncbi:MAG TPA: EAL domain-containing protein, partial [Candidatus Acidoferrales bacterium]|nr:EAL domain-containing protein [Candidatus Acidoferrales bacterium]
MTTRRRAADVLRTLARRDLDTTARAADRSRVDDIADELGPALAAEQLHLVYQPIVDLRTRGCERVEAFIRWRHPRLGLIDPRDIVRFARAGGLLPDLAAFALRAASRERERWRRDGGELALSINLAGDELAERGAIALRNAITAASLDPRVLTFEIPAENALLRDPWEGARRVAALGARIALDDVSRADGLSRAVALEIDELKISRALIRRAVADT